MTSPSTPSSEPDTKSALFLSPTNKEVRRTFPLTRQHDALVLDRSEDGSRAVYLRRNGTPVLTITTDLIGPLLNLLHGLEDGAI